MNAEIRHRAGMSCKNVAVYNYDANGPGRWCVDCGAPLGSAPPDKARFDPFVWVVVLLSCAGLLMVALLVWAWTGGLDGA